MEEAVTLFRFLLKLDKRVFSMRDISTNSKYSKRVLGLLEKYGLVDVHKGSMYVIVLTNRGEKARKIAQHFVSFLEGKEVSLEDTRAGKGREVSLEDLPDYLKNNPWLSVLKERK